MSKTQLRAVDNQQPHDLDIARQRIAQFRLDRDKGFQPLPTTNQHDDRGGRWLDVDACIQCSQPNYAPVHGPSRRLAKIPWWVKLCWWR